MTEKYKRTVDDSPLHCPYCGKQFNATARIRTPLGWKLKQCKHCDNWFYWRNYSAKYCREQNIDAVKEKLNGIQEKQND